MKYSKILYSLLESEEENNLPNFIELSVNRLRTVSGWNAILNGQSYAKDGSTYCFFHEEVFYTLNFKDKKVSDYTENIKSYKDIKNIYEIIFGVSKIEPEKLKKITINYKTFKDNSLGGETDYTKEILHRDSPLFWKKIFNIIKIFNDNSTEKYYSFSGTRSSHKSDASLIVKTKLSYIYKLIKNYLLINIKETLKPNSQIILEKFLAYWIEIRNRVQKRNDLLDQENRSFANHKKLIEKLNNVPIITVKLDNHILEIMDKPDSVESYKTFEKSLEAISRYIESIDTASVKSFLTYSMKIIKMSQALPLKSKEFEKIISNAKPKMRDYKSNVSKVIELEDTEVAFNIPQSPEDLIEIASRLDHLKMYIEGYVEDVISLKVILSDYLKYSDYRGFGAIYRIEKEIKTLSSQNTEMSTADLQKKLESILKELIKPYKLSSIDIDVVQDVINSSTKFYDNIGFMGVPDRETFNKILRTSILQALERQKLVKISSIFDAELERIVEKIPKKVFINNTNFTEYLSMLDFENSNISSLNFSTLFTLSLKGLMAKGTTRDTLYIRKLSRYGISEENIFYIGDTVVFKV